MSHHAHRIATTVEQATDDLVTLLASLAPEQWQAVCPDEGWTVTAAAHHIGDGYQVTIELLEALVRNAPLPELDVAALTANNDARAAQFARCPRDEVIEYLRIGGASVAHLTRGLDDDALARETVFGHGPASVARIVGELLPGHIAGHRASIAAAAGAGAGV
jgi:hypothetical protein